jgi:hypothetical protein
MNPHEDYLKSSVNQKEVNSGYSRWRISSRTVLITLFLMMIIGALSTLKTPTEVMLGAGALSIPIASALILFRNKAKHGTMLPPNSRITRFIALFLSAVMIAGSVFIGKDSDVTDFPMIALIFIVGLGLLLYAFTGAHKAVTKYAEYIPFLDIPKEPDTHE